MMNLIKKSLVVLLSVILTIGCVPVGVTAKAESDYMTLYEDMVIMINEYRALNGLEPLRIYPELCEVAEVRSKESAQYFSHSRPDGRSFSSILSDFGISKLYFGENIASYFDDSVSEVFDAFINSPFHLANILSKDYVCVGIGLYIDDGDYYWTQMFLTGDGNYEDAYVPGSAIDGTSLKTSSNSVDVTLGDINGDDFINASDASDVLGYYSSMSSGEISNLTENQLFSADVNNDGVINASDASSILNYYAQSSMGVDAEF